LPLDWETLVDLEQMVHEVVTRYPVQQFVMIGVGRSPAPLIAWLQELNPRAGFLVSASGLVIEELAHPNECVALLRPQSLLGIVMDRAEHQLRQEPNEET
jgi:hypothetical protein